MPLTINIASGSCNVTAINLAEKEGLTEILKILTERK
jgi:hypothetical protein